jgi:hypothetical protein
LRAGLARICFALALLIAASPAPAWWEYGHETVARIAWLNVSPHSRTEIRRLLAQSRLLETPTCPSRTIAQAAHWPDCIKTLRDRFSYAYAWHQQNIEICRPFDPQAGCRDGNCITAQIARQARLLADRSLPTRERLMALDFLIHFMGDLHQPMHAADHGDYGGNRVPVSYGIIAGRTNLHLIWDGYLAERGISQPPGEAAGILSELSEADKSAIREGGIEDWARESWEAGREFAYGTIMADPCGDPPGERPVIDEATTRRLVPIVRRQIARGGLRLARMLDEALA